METGVSVDDFPLPGNLDTSNNGPLEIPLAPEGTVPLPAVRAGIGLWWTALERTPVEVATLACVLSDEERKRALRFGTDALRSRWIVGRSTLRALLGQALNIAPSAVVLARGRRGRPQLDARPGGSSASVNLDFNVSHTRGMVLIGIAQGLPAELRIGVDVEHSERVVNADGLCRKFLSPRERDALAPMTADERRRGFLRLWTCKEAMSKATGDALSAPFRQLDVAATDAELALVNGPAPYNPAHWVLHKAVVPTGFIATVAVWHSDPTQGATSP